MKVDTKEIANVLNIIQPDVNDACKLAAKKKGEFGGDEINWTEFSCVNIAYSLSVFGEEMVIVYLEGASPECTKINEFVRKHIELNTDAGSYGTVSVETDW